MARLVRKEQKGTMAVKVGNETKWECLCGLSANELFWDGSHKKTLDEQAGKVYAYSKDCTRAEVQGCFSWMKYRRHTRHSKPGHREAVNCPGNRH